MSEPHERMVAKLKGLEPVTGLVAQRIWPLGDVPQDAPLPFVVYRRVDRTPISHAGGSTPDNFTRIQIDLYAGSYDAALALAAAVRGSEDDTPTGLNGWTDEDGRLWLLETEQDAIETLLVGRETAAAFNVSQDYIV